MNKTTTQMIIGGVLIATFAFFGGTAYAKHKTPTTLGATNRQGQFGQMGGPGMGRSMRGNGFSSGEIIGKDDKSITIKLGSFGQSADANANAGSKIIFFSDTTEVQKTVAGSKDDLAIGKNVTIIGQANQDGSINATSIQLRTAPLTIK